MNPGTPFDERVVGSLRVRPFSEPSTPDNDGPATASGAVARHGPRQLVALIRCLDLTSLSALDTDRRIATLCDLAREPLPAALRRRHAIDHLHVAAVCIYPVFLDAAKAALEASSVRIATVAAGFPDGLSPLRTRIAEVAACVEQGATEVDVVIARRHALRGRWRDLYDEVRAFRDAAAGATLKVIVCASELPETRMLARACATCAMAGADFLKTSTGREAAPATLAMGSVMLREIRGYHRRTGHPVGFKAAGGIRTVEQARAWADLYERILGRDASDVRGFRIGASRLLDEIRNAFD